MNCAAPAWLGVLVLALPPAIFAGRAEALPPLFSHRLEETHEIRIAQGWVARPFECTGDSTDEILRITPMHTLCLTLRDGSWIPLWQFNYPAGRFSVFPDACGGGLPGAFLAGETEGGALRAAGYRIPPGADPRLLFRLGPFLGRSPRGYENRRGDVGWIGCFDAWGDGRREAFLSAYPFAPGAEPRRLYAIDTATGDSLWSFYLAPPPTRVSLLTRRGGADRQILVTTYSPANMFFWAGTSDTASYIYSLTPDGQPRWQVRTGGIRSAVQAALADVDGDGQDDIVAGLQWGPHESAEAGSPTLAVLDPATGRFLRTARLPAGALDVRAADLDGDGQIEIVCPTEEEVRVLDRGGRTLASFPVPAPPTVFLARLEGRPQLVVSAGEVAHVMVLRSPLPLAVPAGIVLMAAAGTTVLVVALRRSGRGERLAQAQQSQRALLEAMTAFGHSGASLRVLDRLRYWLVNRERAAERPGGTQTPIARLAQDYRETVLPDLLRIGSLARRAEVPSLHWRPLASLATAAGEGLRGVAAGVDPVVSQRAASVLESLKRIDGCLRGLRLHLAEVFRVSVLPLARQVLEDRRSDLGRAGCRAWLVADGVEEWVVFASAEVLTKVLHGLVDNSLRAMDGVAEKEIEVRIDIEGSRCRIDFRDSGRGIAAADWERVFDRSYTTRAEGGGFGLHYARESLADYEGRVAVLASEPGRGTTIRLSLRLVETGPAVATPRPTEDSRVG